MIAANVLGGDDRHRQIIEDQPFLFVANRQDRMLSPPLIILHNDKPEIIGIDPHCAKCDKFYDRIVLAVAGSTGERLKRGCPLIGITILGPIADWLDAHVDRTIEPAQPGAPLVFSSKFNN